MVMPISMVCPKHSLIRIVTVVVRSTLGIVNLARVHICGIGCIVIAIVVDILIPRLPDGKI